MISGLVNQTITAVTPNPNFSSPAYSPDGSFIYNNLFHPSGMAFDIDGLLFVTAQNPSGYWNLWGNSPGAYSLWELVGSYNYPIAESGNLTWPPRRSCRLGRCLRSASPGSASSAAGAARRVWRPASARRATPQTPQDGHMGGPFCVGRVTRKRNSKKLSQF